MSRYHHDSDGVTLFSLKYVARRKSRVNLFGFLVALLMIFPASEIAFADNGESVKAIVFYKQDCPDCKALTHDILPVFKKRYGDALNILTVNNGDPRGGGLYLSTLLAMNLSLTESLPFVIVGDVVLKGSESVTREFPALVEERILQKKTGWPDIPGLDKVLKAITQMNQEDQASWWIAGEVNEIQYLLAGFAYRYNHDPLANRYAVVVLCCLIVGLVISLYLFFRKEKRQPCIYRAGVLTLQLVGVYVAWQLAEISNILSSHKSLLGSFEDLLAITVFTGMLISLLFSLWSFRGSNKTRIAIWQIRIIPLLSLIVLTAAGYLLYSELSGAEAQCGAVGDCNAVQQSPYAKLFGWISVAGFGIMGILLVTLFWLLYQFGPANRQSLFGLGMWGGLLIGVLFFTYLTFLEPFVIGATCFWCLSAAIAMVLEFYILTPLAGQSWHKLRELYRRA